MSLLEPDLAAEIVVHVRPDGTWQLAVSKLAPDPALPPKVLQALFGAAFDLARVYGIAVTKAEVTSSPKPA